jgi:DNA-directed RNA polymerase specialized sigma24 family protein
MSVAIRPGPWRIAPVDGTMSTMDDDDLAAAFRTGGQAAVRAVYERYGGAVFGIAMSVLGDRELAADAVQVAFLNAWRASGSLEPGRPLAPWLYTIARRASIDLLPPSMEGIWEAWQVRTALDSLPAEERDVVRAQHFAGLSHAQIAEHLGVPLGTVKSRSHRAHRRLASMLGHLVEVSS